MYEMMIWFAVGYWAQIQLAEIKYAKETHE